MIEKNAAFRLMLLITTPKAADKAADVLRAEGIPVEYRIAAVGTATSEIMDMLGLGGIDKTVIFSMISKAKAGEILKKLSVELKFRTANSGIAFTIPLSGASNLMLRMLDNQDTEQTGQRKENTAVVDVKYTMIAAIINRGYSNDVMDAARSAGASGGSVINSRQIADEAVSNKWGLGGHEEKEIVLIAADSEKKVAIMSAITEKCGIQSKANGIVLSVPIDDIIGIEK